MYLAFILEYAGELAACHRIKKKKPRNTTHPNHTPLTQIKYMNCFMELPYFHILLVMFLSSSGKQQASTEDETYKTLLLVSSFQEYGWQNLWVDISLSDWHHRNEVVTTLRCLFLVIQDNMDHQCRFYMLTSGLYIRKGVLCLHLNICFNIGKKCLTTSFLLHCLNR